MYFPLFAGVLCLFCYALFCVHSSFAIILKRKRKLVVLLFFYFQIIVTLNVLWLFFTLPWVGLQCVIVVFPDHTHLLFLVSLSQFIRVNYKYAYRPEPIGSLYLILRDIKIT